MIIDHFSKPFIQIAGIVDEREAQLMMACGVNYLGFPLRLPVNKEDLSEEEAANIIRSIQPPFYSVLITYLYKANEIIQFADVLNTSIVQIHGDITIDELRKLKERKKEITIIKSLVIGENNFDNLKKIISEDSEFVDAFITDTYDPSSGASGATGKTHDWSISKQLVQLSSKPVILAGGLTPENVADAIFEVKPAGVDVHTGVEKSNGRKDIERVKLFIKKSEEAFHKISTTEKQN